MDLTRKSDKSNSAKILNFAINDENTKLLKNFKEKINDDTNIYANTDEQNLSNNNDKFQKIKNDIITIRNNYKSLESTYMNEQSNKFFFTNDNNYGSKKNNNYEPENKYTNYRNAEYVHTNYKTVTNFPQEDNFSEVIDDPVLLEGKVEDQNKLKIKV